MDQQVGNSKTRYISRAKAGAKASQEKGGVKKNRSEFESRKDGYFVWRKNDKREP